MLDFSDLELDKTLGEGFSSSLAETLSYIYKQTGEFISQETIDSL